ncbi:acyltransferase [Tenacibaculum sp. 190524A05c]|uniref:Glucans biosynthesis protein C n=1 Tax=Tenacibaculum platacis TaxID=3137852 RepID=A0ABM9NQE5_9FLAO
MTTKRRYDLDWLRVISVFAVFLHHVFMPFNGDEFHIMNSESSKLLDDVMVYFEQFRLPLLFFVSGVGTVFAFSKRNWKEFIIERSKRLLIPLFFGVAILIPPQTYFENYRSYGAYISEYPQLLIKLKVNHLWFIENLFLLSLFLIPIILFFRSRNSEVLKSFIKKVTSKYGFIIWCLTLVVIRVITKYYFPEDDKSFMNPSTTLYFGFFFISGIIISSTTELWELLLKNRRKNLLYLILSSGLFYFYYFIPREYISPYFSLATRWSIWYVVCSLVSWSAIITILGYGQKLLNKRSELLKKLNEAVYPFYMLHQTVIIILGYFILQFQVSITAKIIILMISSFLSIVILYLAIIYPFSWVRFLFGMKNNPGKRRKFISKKLQ